MTLHVAIKAPPCPSLNATAFLLLQFEGHFCLIKRKLREFQHLERQLQLESKQSHGPGAFASIVPTIQTYCDARPSVYSSHQLGARLAVALEDFIRQFVMNCDFLNESTALKTFFDGTLLSSHKRYQDVVESALHTTETEMMDERVAAGCTTEHVVAVDEEQLLLWKFASPGSGLVFSAEFSVYQEKETIGDPYSVNNNNDEWDENNEVVCYQMECHFTADGGNGFVYGHFVALKRGIVTLQWENVNMDNVVSIPLQFQVMVLPLAAGKTVLDVAAELNPIDSSEWLHHFMLASKVTSLADLPEWKNYDNEGSMLGFDASEDHHVGVEHGVRDPQLEIALLEERTLQLEAQVSHLAESLTTTKKELTSAQARAQNAETINKATLEAITQLERANVGSHSSKLTKNVENTSTTSPAAVAGTQQEKIPSNELEWAQKLCACFQEQCLWRSVENMELETHLAASQVETTSWRREHMEQGARIEQLEEQNRTLRAHKKMLVEEVKRLQPYSQVNVAALVQEAQEARMMQRSLQAKLDTHERLARMGATAETSSSDFVFVEASYDER